MRDRNLARWLGKLSVAGVAAVLCGCVARAEPGVLYYGAPGHYVAPVQVPPGHLPPPGQCRVWFADRPPGQQPSPGPCEVLQYQVPPGAFLVRG